MWQYSATLAIMLSWLYDGVQRGDSGGEDMQTEPLELVSWFPGTRPMQGSGALAGWDVASEGLTGENTGICKLTAIVGEHSNRWEGKWVIAVIDIVWHRLQMVNSLPCPWHPQSWITSTDCSRYPDWHLLTVLGCLAWSCPVCTCLFWLYENPDCHTLPWISISFWWVIFYHLYLSVQSVHLSLLHGWFKIWI
jgi:hypothetical protein